MCVSNMLSFANSLQTHKYCQSCPVLKGVHWTNSNSASMALRHRMYPLEICAVVSWQSMQNLLRCFSFWSKWSPTRHCQPETQTAKTRRITFLCWSECIPSVWKNQEQKKKNKSDGWSRKPPVAFLSLRQSGRGQNHLCSESVQSDKWLIIKD